MEEVRIGRLIRVEQNRVNEKPALKNTTTQAFSKEHWRGCIGDRILGMQDFDFVQISPRFFPNLIT